MNNCRTLTRGLVFITIFWVSLFASAQTFEIQSRTASEAVLGLDRSVQLTYTVRASGVANGTALIPSLRTTNSSLASALNFTWTGNDVISSSSTFTVTFNVHSSDSNLLCDQTIPLELSFSSSGFSNAVTASAVSSDDLSLTTTGGGQIRLTHLLGETRNLPYPLSTDSGVTFPIFVSDLDDPTIVDDKRYRIYFWADLYYLEGRPNWYQNWLFLNWRLSADCVANIPRDFENYGDTAEPNINPIETTVPVVDVTSGTPEDVTLHDKWGAGPNDPTLGTGVTLYDVTDLPLLACGNDTWRDRLEYDGSNYVFSWEYTGISAVMRRMALYLGQEGDCEAVETVFGTPTDQTFHINNIQIASNGDVDADLVVPSAWAPGGTLDSRFSVRWYLRSDSDIFDLGSTGQTLSVAGTAGQDIADPKQYYLEARVTHEATGYVVSTNNSNDRHYLNYSVSNIPAFANAETVAVGNNQDRYLDPGEIVTLSQTVSDPDAGSLPTLSFAQGYVVDSNDNLILDSSDQVFESEAALPNTVNMRLVGVSAVAGTSNRRTDASFELLNTSGLENVWFFIDTTMTSGNTTSTYRSFMTLRDADPSVVRDLNAQLVTEVYDYQFTSATGWTMGRSVTSGTATGTGGWSHDNGQTSFVGEGSVDTDDSGTYYTLRSPTLPVGTSTTVTFNHLPQFSFNQSGGLLEYRLATNAGGSFGSWRNFLQEQCDGGCVSGYFATAFPPSPTSYLSGKMVWMTNEDSASEVIVNPDDSLAQTNEEVQFRFTFADPSLVATGTSGPRSDGPTDWRVDDFNYQTTYTNVDNIFGIASTSLGCEDLSLQLVATAPIAVANLNFEWFQSLQDLYDGNSNGQTPGSAGLTVPFIEDDPGTFNYFVKITFSSVVRILPITVEFTEGCSAACLTAQQVVDKIQIDGQFWPATKSINDCVNIVNRTCVE